MALGTHPQPMDRLLQTIDSLMDAGTIKDEVVVQAATYGFRPRLARLEGVRSFDWLHEQIRRADVVISHAGPGTLAVVRALGRVPVVVPRSSAAGEHVDDHQLQYAARLRGSPGYIVLTDLADLPGAIAMARASGVEPVVPDVSRAVAALDRLMDQPR